MHVISRKSLRDFWERHPESQASLVRWFKIVSKSKFENFAQVRDTFPSADKVGDLIVFNIGGNNYRLVASVHFNRQKLYVRYVLTHRDYDRGRWKQ